MYQAHPSIVTPEDDTKIWRYMDFMKFVDILDKSKLFFPSVEQLGDPFEGSYTRANITFRKENIDLFFTKELLEIIDNDNAVKALRNSTRLLRSCIHISCWNKSEDESAALWQLYCSGTEGIAIQSTVGHLKKSLENEKQDIFLGEVSYIDYTQEFLPKTDIDFLITLLYKRRSFKHEREIRAIIFPRPVTIGKNMLKVGRRRQYYANINPDMLIDRVYISPLNEKWKKKLVESILFKYGLRKKVFQSNLSSKRALF